MLSPPLPNSVQVLAPAKLNLHLELLGRRPDGYHELETAMVAIDCFDRLTVRSVAQAGTHTRCRWLPHAALWRNRLGEDATPEATELPRSEKNLVTSVLERFREAFAITTGFEVAVDKQIPAGAGMGGASSDAAAALRAAARLSGIAEDHPGLQEIAAESGSDIPFFLSGGSSSRHRLGWATGRGEQVEARPLRGHFHFVVVYPPVSLSTAEVYRHAILPASPQPADALLQQLAEGNRRQAATRLLNRLQIPARSLRGVVAERLDRLQRGGAVVAQLTGSGSACFGICRTRAAAVRLARRMAAGGQTLAIYARPVAVPMPLFCTPGRSANSTPRGRVFRSMT